MSENIRHILTIEKLVPGGLGLGRLESGIIVLVRHVLPSEKVLVREVTCKKDYISAIVEEILSPSPDRVTPPCPVYGLCGGCDLQHAKPETQIRLKNAILVESLQRAAGNIFPDHLLTIEDPWAAPAQFGYRQRLRFQVDRHGNYGFYRADSHVLEPISQCLLGHPALNKILQQIHHSASFRELLKHCHAFELLFNPANNTTVLLLHFQRKPRPTDSLLAVELADSVTGLATVLMQVEGYGLYDPRTRTFPASSPVLTYFLSVAGTSPPLTLSWEVGEFCQVNLDQNNNLIKLVLAMAGTVLHKKILDLFCGYGNFSLPLAQLGAEILGIDVQNAAIRNAQRNAQYNALRNSRFTKKQVPAAVAELLAAGKTFDTIILDPPRQGAADIMAELPRLSPRRIIYISCNPATLARDLSLLHPAGYTLSRLTPVDMFPQTHHLECVTLLER